jgi:dolichol-phosphate mannosyltransferase
MKKLVIIPTYNESENIIKLINKILSFYPDLDVLIIDDNSPDGTSQLIKNNFDGNKRIFLITREKKLGLGSALFTGYNFVVKNNYDFAIQMDADFSHNPKTIGDFLDNSDNATIIIGSRYIKGGKCVGWNWRRRFLSRFANFYVRFWLRINIKDATSGFRLFPVSFLKEITKDKVCSAGYLFQIEMIWKAIKEGYKVKEIPITFKERSNGSSKLGRNQIIAAAIGVPKFFFKK